MRLKKSFTVFLFFFALPFLVQAQQPSLVLPVGHTGIVRSARFSIDGKYVITGGADRVMKVWQTFSGKMVQTFSGSKGEIYDAFFSSNTKYAAVITDSAVYLWSVTDGRLIRTFEGISESFFSPDNKRLFLQSLNGTVTQVLLEGVTVERIYTDSVLVPLRINRSIRTAAISDDGRLLATANNNILAIHNVHTGVLLARLQTEGGISNCFFVPGNKYLVAISDKAMKKIELVNYTITDFGNGEGAERSWLSSNRNYLLTCSGMTMYDIRIRFWNTITGKDITGSINYSSKYDTSFLTEPDGTTKVVTGTLEIPFPRRELAWGVNASIADDGNTIYVRTFTWNHEDPAKSAILPVVDYNLLKIATISPDSRYLLVQDKAGEVLLWDIQKQKVQSSLSAKTDILKSAGISPDGHKAVITGGNELPKVINLLNGKTESVLKGHHDEITNAVFSADGKTVLTNSLDSTGRLWDATTGELLEIFKGHHPDINPVYFTRGKLVLPTAKFDSIPVYDVNDPEKIVRYEMLPRIIEYRSKLENAKSKSGRYSLIQLPDGSYALTDTSKKHDTAFSFTYSPLNKFSTNERWLAIADQFIDTLLIWDIANRKVAYSGKMGIIPRNRTGAAGLSALYFSPDDQYLACEDVNEIIHFKSTTDFKTITTLEGSHISFDTANKYFVVVNKGTCEVYERKDWKFLYTFISVDSANSLLVDAGKRYDGTVAARKLLYYSCGNEVVDLEQFKDQLWVPNLAERIMKGDGINAKTLSELNICGLTPEVEDKSTAVQFRFHIKPRSGGLGETVVYINGIEARRYKPDQLKKSGEVYELKLSKNELGSYFIAGKENPVTVKAYTADNAISSRGIIINEDKTQEKITAAPNLYAVMVGVSDYKDDELDLKYAAKDANDISAAVAASARKLLNSDGKEHVFVYDLTTSEKRYQLPEKNSVKKVLEEIGKKATANDILLLFFAGHGVMSSRAGEQQQFYFLTADASKTTAASAVADVGISTAELTEWMKPQSIKAQKRILIFDACNSGQAIRDLVKVGNEGQGYMAARSDEQSQQIKAIDKLNEQSGFFILSASASNQSAYEMGRYSQGLLTYSLLKAIKQQPDILADGKYLDVSRWFNAAEKTVTELTKETGARQQPQVISNTNFTIGIVDEEVMAKIVLPQEKPLFAASNFQNSDENIADDDLELSKLINLQLNDMASRGASSKIVYVTATNSPDAYSLTGRYTINNKVISVQVNLKQNKLIKARFELRGTSDKLNELAAAVALKAADLIK